MPSLDTTIDYHINIYFFPLLVVPCKAIFISAFTLLLPLLSYGWCDIKFIMSYALRTHFTALYHQIHLKQIQIQAKTTILLYVNTLAIVISNSLSCFAPLQQAQHIHTQFSIFFFSSLHIVLSQFTQSVYFSLLNAIRVYVFFSFAFFFVLPTTFFRFRTLVSFFSLFFSFFSYFFLRFYIGTKFSCQKP